MRVIQVRYETAPTPMGCRWCGVPQRKHCQRWVPGRGFHVWAEPTRAQIEARLRARFAARTEQALKNSPKECPR